MSAANASALHHRVEHEISSDFKVKDMWEATYSWNRNFCVTLNDSNKDVLLLSKLFLSNSLEDMAV